MPDNATRNRTIGATVAIGAIGAIAGLVGAALRFGLFDRLSGKGADTASRDAADDAREPDGSPEAPYDFRPPSLVAVTNTDSKVSETSVH